jgi:hypothetical protein
MQKINFTSHSVHHSLSFRLNIFYRLVSVAAAWLSILVLAIQPVQAAEESAGVILAFTGKIEITHGTEKYTPAKHANLYSGDTINTGTGQVQIRFADGTLLTLYRDTKFSVDDYHYGKGKDDRAKFSLLSGLMHTLTGHIDKTNYQLKTRLATLGVRGTEYSAQLGEALKVSVDQGRVQLANAGGTVLVGAGQSIIITGPNAIPQPIMGGKINLGMHGPGGTGGGGGAGGGAGPGGGGAGAGPGGPGPGPAPGPAPGPGPAPIPGGAGGPPPGMGGAAPGGMGVSMPPPPPPPGTQKY